MLDSEFNNNYDDHLNRSSIGRNSFLTPIGVNSIVQKQLNNAVSDLKDPRFIIVKRSGENSQENFHYKRHFEVSKGSFRIHRLKIIFYYPVNPPPRI